MAIEVNRSFFIGSIEGVMLLLFFNNLEGIE
jgi:hypothetical protein